ncbi:peptidoglycan DD-metalloendopeptidase family protein [Desulfosporosinus fructosivorans]
MKVFNRNNIRKNLKETLNLCAFLHHTSWKSSKIMAFLILGLVLVGSGVYYVSSTTSEVSVSVNGTEVGLVSDVKSGENLIHQFLVDKGTPLGVVANTHDNIEYSSIRVRNGDVRTLSKETLEEELSVYIDGVELAIDNKSIFILPNQEDVQKLLQAYQQIYVQKTDTNQIDTVSYEEKVEIRSVEVAPEEVLTTEEALEKLKQGDVRQEEYVVQPDDSWWLIARKNEMRTSEVLAGNPGVNEDTVLQIGQTINLVKVFPYLTVIAEGIRTETETIPFDVVTIVDSSLANGETKITQTGSDGEKEVKYAYAQKNDKIMTKEILDEQVLKDAVSQVVVKGPQRTPVVIASSRGSGQLASGMIWPINGRINSYYGYREGEFHTGLDINGYQGDPYVAATAGTVVSAGWDGNYGNSILIDHGNGILTRYAHSSKLLVAAGQKVSKGQTIGLVGSTGRSSGPHLHFEVIINGDYANPFNYLR